MNRGRPGVPPRRIRETADALLQRGIRPTIHIIRRMIGGSPNTIAPVLREWRETLTPEQQLHLPLADSSERTPAVPPMIVDLTTELWQRAIVFATIECKGSPQALQLATLSEETEQLRASKRSLQDRLEAELAETANLRVQLSEFQGVVKAALEKAKISDARYAAAISAIHSAKARLARTTRRQAAERQVTREIGKARSLSKILLSRRAISPSTRIASLHAAKLRRQKSASSKKKRRDTA
jgi:hypothetical protein